MTPVAQLLRLEREDSRHHEVLTGIVTAISLGPQMTDHSTDS
jgi:hypothetical protein